jgi:hypothetical protein
MNVRLFFPAMLLCVVILSATAGAEDYMGGEIVLGGSGPRTISVTEVATTTAQVIATAPPQAIAATGSVSIQTSPSGAGIYIDGVRQGISPATIPGLSPGAHTAILKKDGYDDLSVPVSVTAGQTQSYTLVLTQSAAAEQTALPAVPSKKTPGFGILSGIAALGAVLLAGKNIR